MMKRVSLIPIVIIGLLGLIAVLLKVGFNSTVANKQADGSTLMVNEAHAAEKAIPSQEAGTRSVKRCCVDH